MSSKVWTWLASAHQIIRFSSVFFFQAEDGIRDRNVTGVQTCALPISLAGDAGVKRLALFHHEPEHGDEAIDALLAAARRQARAKGLPAEVVAAQEGMT